MVTSPTALEQPQPLPDDRAGGDARDPADAGGGAQDAEEWGSIVAIENLLPDVLVLNGEAGRTIVLSPLERRAATESDLAGFSLKNAEAKQSVRLIRRRTGKLEGVLEKAPWFLAIGGIAYFVVGSALYEEVERQWQFAYWLGVPAIAAFVGLWVALWASGRSTSTLTVLGYQAALLCALVCGVGLPLLALFLTDNFEALRTGVGISGEERLAIGLQVAIISLLSLVPALFYYLFDRERVGTVQASFFRSLFSLDEDLRNLRDAEVKYGARAEEFFGKADETRSGRVVRGQRLPILIATVFITGGWIYTLMTTTEAGSEALTLMSYLEPREHPLAYAFLGAYFFTLMTLARRFSHGDLTAKAYGQVLARIVLATILAWIVTVTMGMDSDSRALLLGAFIVGVFPESGLLFVRESLPVRLRQLLPPLEEKMPLTDLEGIDFYDRVRLGEEGVNNVQALVRHDPVSLMLHTRIPVSRLVDWVDQAILYLHTTGHAGEDSEDIRALLRRYGIRTATDLAAAVENNGETTPDGLSVIAGDERAVMERLRLIYLAVQGQPLYRTVARWRASSRSAPKKVVIEACPAAARSGTGEAPTAAPSTATAAAGHDVSMSVSPEPIAQD